MQTVQMGTSDKNNLCFYCFRFVEFLKEQNFTFLEYTLPSDNDLEK